MILARTYGVQYLDYKVPAQMLMDTEPDLLRMSGLKNLQKAHIEDSTVSIPAFLACVS